MLLKKNFIKCNAIMYVHIEAHTYMYVHMYIIYIQNMYINKFARANPNAGTRYV